MNLFRRPVVFGAADGITVALGIILSLASAAPAVVVKAAIGAGLAELVGMTAGQWLSDDNGKFLPALANGSAALVACVIPAVPYLLAGGTAALAAAMALIAFIGAVLAWLRPEHGAKAVAQTYGVLAVAAVLCYAASLI